jgi:DNA-binding LytR/AlgR family response regulator
MINIIIIEDQQTVRDQIVNALYSVSSNIEIVRSISTVEEGIDFMAGQPAADLILSDVQLPDGLSFEIFQQSATNIPIVFITGYDEFIMTAFNHNAIDYLLKPVSAKELDAVLKKYKSLEQHFNPASVRNLLGDTRRKKKSRLIVRKGIENIALKIEDIVLIHTENKIVYVTDKKGRKFIADNNLGELEEELDEQLFFRANRQYLVNMNYIRGYKSYERVKLQVDLTLPELNHVIIVSQETAPDFRKWLYEA